MSNRDLSVFLAHGNDARRKVVSATLELLQHQVGLSTASPAVLCRRCQEQPPDVAIVGSDFEDDDIFAVLNRLTKLRLCAVVALLRNSDIERSRRLLNDRVMGILVEPVSEGDLRTSIHLARRRFTQSQRLEYRVRELKHQLVACEEGHANE